MKKLTLTLLFFALLLTACSGAAASTPASAPQIESAASQPTLAAVTAEGVLLPAASAELSFAQGGLIADVLVQPGETVAAGSLLARLVGIESAQAEMRAAELEQTLAQQALDDLHRTALLTAAQAEKALLEAQEAYESEANGWNIGDRDKATDLELALDSYISSEEEYSKARDKLDDVLDLDESDRERSDAQSDLDDEIKNLAADYADLLGEAAANDQPLDEEQTALLNAIAVLEVARENHSRLTENNLDPDQLAGAEAQLEAAAAHLAAAKASLALYELRAPFDGTLLSLDLTAGESAVPGLPVVFLADISRWTVETKDLAEIDIARVALGQAVTIKLDAFPGEQFTGLVTAIDPVGKEYLGDMTYKVTITLDEADVRFMWNMTAIVTVEK